jgi:hypothetical protein
MTIDIMIITIKFTDNAMAAFLFISGSHIP